MAGKGNIRSLREETHEWIPLPFSSFGYDSVGNLPGRGEAKKSQHFVQAPTTVRSLRTSQPLHFNG